MGWLAVRRRGWWSRVAYAVALIALAWLAIIQSPVLIWLVYGSWGAFIVAVVARALRSGARGQSTRSVAEPAISGLGEIQNLYLGRPDLGPTVYGRAGDSDTELVVPTPDRDPGDLR